MKHTRANRSVVTRFALAAAAVAVLPALAPAAIVTLTATDTAGNTSFNTGTRWSDLQPPSAANDYLVPGGLALRTPADSNSIVFAGNSLTLGNNGASAGTLTLKNLTNTTTTINNLTLDKGTIQNGGTAAGAATSLILNGNGLTVTANGGTFDSGGAGRLIDVAAPISGSGPITIANAGAITFSVANSYTGATTVTGGALNATDGVGLSGASALVLNGGALGTSGTFTRGLGTGAGQVSFTGTGGFTATNAGGLVVALGGTAAPTPLVAGTNGFAPTSLILNYSSALGTTDFRNAIDLNNQATFGVSVNSTTAATSGTISGNITGTVGTGGFTKTGAGILNLTGTNTYSGPTILNANTGSVRAVDGVGLSPNTNLTLNGGVFETNTTFTRAVGTDAGQVSFNAVNGGVIGAYGNDITVAFGGTASPTPLVFGSTPGFVGTSALILGGPNQGSLTLTLTNALDLNGVGVNRTIASQGGLNVVTGVISNSAAGTGTLNIEGNGTATAGTIVLAAANTYGGTTYLDPGAAGSATVRATNGQAFGTSLIQFTTVGNATTSRLELANNVTVANNINLTGRNNTTDAIRNVSDSNTLAGTISVGTGGSAYIIQSDAGLLTLTGASGSTPGTAITAGNGVGGARVITLQGNGNGRVTGAITNNAATLALTKAGSGTWTLTAANTFTGPTIINQGTLQLGDGTTGNDGSLANTSGVTNNGTLAYNRFGTTTAAYVISGTGAVVKSGAGTQVLTGANTYTGVTTVNGGTLRLAAAAQAPVLTNAGGADVRNGTLQLDGASAATIRGLLKASFDEATTPGVMETGQIRSSTATTARGLGYADIGTGVIVKAALFGDADLDGGVSINDFNALAGNFGQSSGKVWVDGDFDYDGGVSINDFNLLAGGFGQSLPASSELWSGLLAFAAAHNDLVAFEAVTGVPEPTSLGLIAAGATLGLRRRRRA